MTISSYHPCQSERDENKAPPFAVNLYKLLGTQDKSITPKCAYPFSTVRIVLQRFRRFCLPWPSSKEICFGLVSFLFLRLQVSPLVHRSSSFWVFNPDSSTLLFVTFIAAGLFVNLLLAHNKAAVLAAKSPFLSDFVTAGVNLLKQFPSAVPFNEGLAREQAYAKSTADLKLMPKLQNANNYW